MKRKIILFWILISFMIVVSLTPLSSSLAQNAEGDPLLDETVTDAIIVVGAGLGGALLGLSTLPFVEVPKDHLNNILIGGSIGIIIGVGVVAYRQAFKSQAYYKDVAFHTDDTDQHFSTHSRYVWHEQNHYQKSMKNKVSSYQLPQFSYMFSF